VTDPHEQFGPHDYRALLERTDVLTFETEPLRSEIVVSGAIVAEISASCDCRDFDLWVRLQDVHPDGRAFNLMSPGNDVVRASYRDPAAGRQPVEPNAVYLLRLPSLLTSIRLGAGHRLRVQLSGAFAPHMSRNLQTGLSEITSSESRAATITIRHDAQAASRLLLPVVSGAESAW
jgi:putative CocE/NonD family hydrolase